eukprot:1036286-Pyramimonas_sp.AAC.1
MELRAIGLRPGGRAGGGGAGARRRGGGGAVPGGPTGGGQAPAGGRLAERARAAAPAGGHRLAGEGVPEGTGGAAGGAARERRHHRHPSRAWLYIMRAPGGTETLRPATPREGGPPRPALWVLLRAAGVRAH